MASSYVGAIKIACLVEGFGEVSAFPLLLRRLVDEHTPGLWADVSTPIRIQPERFSIGNELARALQLAAGKAGPNGGIIILHDCDDGCPATDGPNLLSRACAILPHMPISVVLAHREYEAWFLAAARSLRGRRNLPMDLEPPANPESIRNAKGWLSDQMPRGFAYSPAIDQPALSQLFDLNEARVNSSSFDKLSREVTKLIETLQAKPS